MNALQLKKQRLIAQIHQQRCDLIESGGYLQAKVVVIDRCYQQLQRLYRTAAMLTAVIGLIRILKKPVKPDNMSADANHELTKRKRSIALQAIKLAMQLFV